MDAVPEPPRPSPPAEPRSPARAFPDGVPILVDPASGVTLRAHQQGDIPSIVEMATDQEMIRFTVVPTPEGGYGESNAAEFLARVRTWWEAGSPLAWAIEADRAGRVQYCGNIDLRLEDDGIAEVGFALHPGARGRSIMSNALRLVRDYGFDVLGLRVIRWRAAVGNWASRRVASAAGFRFDGSVRRLLGHRGELVDGWLATITSDDDRLPQQWSEPTPLRGPRVMLRAFVDSDVDRIAEACSDPDSQRWLAALPFPYEIRDAHGYLLAIRELAALGRGLTWCAADPATGRCHGSVGVEGLGGYARRVEIGYWTHPDARGRGLTAEAVRLVTAHLETAELADSIMIRCAARNTASRHVALAAGYRKVGMLRASEPLRDGTLADLVLYARP
jgi:[ribosomal protein S5]-alanine N-acetyltransferase